MTPSDPFVHTLNAELARLRGRETQIETARRIGISDQTLSNWKRGRNKPGYADLRSLAQRLPADPRELLGVRNGSAPLDRAAVEILRDLDGLVGIKTQLPALKPLARDTDDLLDVLARVAAYIQRHGL